MNYILQVTAAIAAFFYYTTDMVDIPTLIIHLVR